MVVTLGQQNNIGENPIVIMYTYINRHAGTPNRNKTQNNVVEQSSNKIDYDNSAIEPYDKL